MSARALISTFYKLMRHIDYAPPAAHTAQPSGGMQVAASPVGKGVVDTVFDAYSILEKHLQAPIGVGTRHRDLNSSKLPSSIDSNLTVVGRLCHGRVRYVWTHACLEQPTRESKEG